MPKRIIDAAGSKIMRHLNIIKSSIKISTDYEKYSPGEIINADIELKLAGEIRARTLEISLNCVQTKREKSHREMDQYDYRLDKETGIPRSTNLRTTYYEKIETVYSEKKRINVNGKFSSDSFAIEFEIPYEAKKTKHNYDYDDAKIEWFIFAKMDIPNAMDIHSTKKIEMI